MPFRNIIILIIAGVAGFILLNSAYRVDETQQALVLQFGDPVRVVNAAGKTDEEGNTINEAGLHFKLPFAESVIHFDKRNLGFDAEKKQVTAAGEDRLYVDAFVRWQIKDPLKFYQSFGDEISARQRLAPLLENALRAVAGDVTSTDIVSGQRAELMVKIQSQLNAQTRDFGIDTIDVRIKRADLLPENAEGVYNRMRTERVEMATKTREDGLRDKKRIEAEANKEAQIIVAKAREQAEIIRGEGDAERNRIYAEAYNRDASTREFFSFYRSLQAYEKTFEQSGTPLILSPDSEYFRYFGDRDGQN